MSVVCAVESDRSGIFSFAAVYDAYMRCRKRKRNTINALKFEIQAVDKILELSAALARGSYQPARSVCFVTGKPKAREIMAADFGDRVVHHWLVPRLEAIYEPKFIFDSYACRRGKGTHAAVRRLQSFMVKATHGNRTTAWFLQLDIHNYFMSIDHDILCRMLARHVKDDEFMRLAETIIRHDCTSGAVRKGPKRLYGQVPSHKSLFHVPPGKGLPIGNLTSQFFANVYLNALDQFVKHELKCHWYLRYVDDFVLVDTDPERLLAARDRIMEFLGQELGLRLKEVSSPRPVGNGADFLGYIVRPEYLLVRRRVVGNLKEKLAGYANKFAVHGIVERRRYTCYHFRPEVVASLRQTLASYLGHCKHAESGGLVRHLFREFPFLSRLFVEGTGHTLVSRLAPPNQPRNLREQYGWFVSSFPGHCLFFQVGNHCEMYGGQALRYASLFHLRVAGGDKPGAKGGRRGMGPTAGFPLRFLIGMAKCLGRCTEGACHAPVHDGVAGGGGKGW